MGRAIEGPHRRQGGCGVTSLLTSFRKDAIIRNSEKDTKDPYG